MARKRFTPEQIVAILRDSEKGGPREEFFKKHGISEQTYYRWKKMYGGLIFDSSDLGYAQEEENRRLKELAGNQALIIEGMKEYQKKRGWL